MGSQLTALAPAQILPMESYFSELPDYGKPTSLGSTRFMKVARSKYSDGTEVVVKIFPKIDSSVQLQSYEKRLHDIQVRTHDIANALPYQSCWELDKAAFLVRQHIHYNLYDRISTRPYLNNIEKKWIVFQLLKALEECHEKKIFHGDLKTENVLLTSWDWVLLTDFASFKPTLLPADNPADYTFFFDTSRRRTCYIAPERFVHSANFTNYSQNTGNYDTVQKNKHYSPMTVEMDIFSLGCVTAELFLDGQHLFDLSQLLDYCQREYSPEHILKRIPDKNIKKMIRHMIQLKPSDRLRAEKYLAMYKGLIFPEYFYNFLHDYFKSFTTTSHLTPDQCIKKLYGDIEAILANLFLNSKRQERETGYGDVLVIVLAAITSNLRVAQFAASKLQALEMMKTIAHYVTDECILDRIIPFLHVLVRDNWSSVRAEAVRTLSFCLSIIRRVPRSDFNLFPEYILPVISAVPKDIDVYVRIALAESVAELALSSLRFLELAQLQINQDAASDEGSHLQYRVHGTYDNELSQLHNIFQSIIVHLFSDYDSNVKRAFLCHSAGKLCTFFGAQKAKEIILSHMITFLNDKANWELHSSFFQAIIDVVTQIGQRSLDILEALLQQGLSDTEEVVICEAINAMTILCERKLFDLRFLCSSLQQIVPFLSHPNIWGRYSAVGFILAAARNLDDIDILCYIIPLIQPFLRHSIINLNDKLVLLNALKDPIPRPVLDYIMKQQNLDGLFECLAKIEVGQAFNFDDAATHSMDSTQKQLYRKLTMLGLLPHHEKQLLVLKEQIFKQHSNKQQSNENDPLPLPFRGLYDLKDLHQIIPRSVPLVYESVSLPSTASTKSRRSTSKNTHQLHLEWGLMFSETSIQLTPQDLSVKVSPPSNKRMTSAKSKDTISISTELSQSAEKLDSKRVNESGNHRRVRSDGGTEHAIVFDKPPSLVRVEQTTCMENLQSLLNHKKELYIKDMQGMDRGYLYFPFYQAPSGWLPKGQLVAHIHDHLQSVNKIKVLPDSSFFASFSDDGTTKLWDVNKMEGLHVINKPRLTYSQQAGKIKTGCFCMCNQSIVSASSDGSIHVYSIEVQKQKNPKVKEVLQWQLDPKEQGSIVEINEISSGGQNVISFVTTKGKLCGLDLRMQELAWDLKNDPKYGLMLSMALDPFQNWVALGTSLGYHVIWDLRFNLPIRHWQHEGHGKPYVHRIQQLSPHPSQPSSLISAASGNNEVSIWDMETATRRQMIWASPTQPFGYMTDNPQQHNSVRSLYTYVIGNSPMLLTGGTDRFIRLWNLNNASESSCIVKPDVASERIDITYSAQVIEGVDVLRELRAATRSGGASSESPQNDSHIISHVDYITSLAIMPYKSPQNVTQQFLISSSHDGVIKLWK